MKQKILIVDDKKENLFALRQVLRGIDAEIIEAQSGNEALTATLDHDFAMGILDVQMPGMTGYELAEYLRGDPKTQNIPIIFLTAFYGDEQHVFKGYAAGGVDYITKPYPPQILLGKVRIFLEMDRARQELAMHRNHLATLVAAQTAQLEQQIEEIRKAKEEWELAFEAVGDIATIQDLNHRIIRANRKAGELLGLSSTELVGKLCHEVFHGRALPCAECPVVVSTRDKTMHHAEIIHKKLGKTFSVSASPIFDQNGELTRIFHIARDITELRELEKQVRQAQKMEAIGTLAGGIAHDFNNILSIIFGYTELAMMEDADPAKRHQQLKELLAGANRARELVLQILAFSRKTEQQKQILQVSTILKESLKMLRSSIPTTIEIKQNILSNGVVLANPTQIHQIIMNLCTNAYHAMREKGGTLSVSLTDVQVGAESYAGAALSPGRYLHLEVSDTGCGIEPKILDKIFEPYFTTKKVGEGTGLGLAVVHGIVKNHQGHITVNSEPGKGTTFHVYLPLVEQAAKALPEKEEPKDIRGNGERILLVDDEEQIRQLAATILTLSGYQVEIHSDGMQALEAFQQDPRRFDLILTDMTMPSLTGSELAGKILALRPEMPIILCTGQSDLINREKALAMGIRDFLVKPFLRNDLLASVRRAVEPLADRLEEGASYVPVPPFYLQSPKKSNHS